MKNIKRVMSVMKMAALAGSLSLAVVSNAAVEAIYNQPMSNGSGIVAKPNLLYLMDNSGSMAQGYVPDEVNDSNACLPAALGACTTVTNDNFDVYSTAMAVFPALASVGYNGLYYNPNSFYQTPIYYDANNGRIPFLNSPPAAAYRDVYTRLAATATVTSANIGTLSTSSGTSNLLTSYTNYRYCTDSSGTSCISNDNNVGNNKTSNLLVNGTQDWATTYDTPVQYSGGPFYYQMTGSPVYCSSAANTTATSNTGPCSTRRDATLYRIPYWGDVNQTAASITPASLTIGVSSMGSGSRTLVNPTATGTVSVSTYSTSSVTGTVTYRPAANMTVTGGVATATFTTPSAQSKNFTYTTASPRITALSGTATTSTHWSSSAITFNSGAGTGQFTFSPTSSNPLIGVNRPLVAVSAVLGSPGSTALNSNVSCSGGASFTVSTVCTVNLTFRANDSGTNNTSITLNASATPVVQSFAGSAALTNNATADLASIAANLFSDTAPANFSLSAAAGVSTVTYTGGGVATVVLSGASSTNVTRTLSTNNITFTSPVETAVNLVTVTLTSSAVPQTGNAATDAASAAATVGSSNPRVAISASGNVLTATMVAQPVLSGPTFAAMGGTNASATNGSNTSVVTVTENPTTVSGGWSATSGYTGDANADATSMASSVAAPANFSYTASGVSGTFAYTGTGTVVPGSLSVAVSTQTNGASAVASPPQVSFSVNESANANVRMRVTATVRNGAVVVGGPWAAEAFVVTSTYNTNGNRQTLANALIAVINGGGFSAVAGTICPINTSNTCTPTIVITAPTAGASVAQNSYAISYSGYSSSPTPGLNGGTTFTGFREAVPTLVNAAPTFEKVRIVATTATYARSKDRIDCALTLSDGSKSCTYAEEVQNFANWFSYYRNRLLSTKGSVSIAFDPISGTSPGSGWRVGLMFTGIADTSSIVSNFNSSELVINDFNLNQKASFYKKFMATGASNSTPLRELASRAGWYFAGKMRDSSNNATDPVQYSCQVNAAFMSTDGYWNRTGGYALGATATGTMGDQDGPSSIYNNQSPFFDVSASSNTLSDVAAYYHDTDLRSPSLGNCSGAISGVDVCVDNAPADSSGSRFQKMIFYALSFGAGGTLNYNKDYLTGGSSDYNAILAGTKDWPTPVPLTMTAIDDLWHATVNGRGQFFNASDPAAVSGAFATAIQQLGAVVGASSAAATSSLEPVAGDNFAYIASFRTSKWDGDVQSQAIDLTSGTLSSTSIWSAQSQLDAMMGLTGGAPYPTATTAGRTLFTYDPAASTVDKKKLLTWANVNADATLRSYFAPSQVASCGGALLPLCPGETSQTLFEYLMGQVSTTGNFRPRDHILGDIINSQPVYVKAGPFAYYDTGYTTFKNSVANRDGAVYVGGNDGFLHAFKASDGTELWAYAPRASMPNMFQLADKGYSHQAYVDGYISVGDIQSDMSDATSWKTLLVAGLGNGGKTSVGGTDSFVGMDVTDPAAPKVLWEFTDTTMGKTFGNPLITKVCATGCGTSGATYKWVVIVANGYNTTSPATLLVIDAATGVKLYSITTSSGANAGMNKINNWVDAPTVDNRTNHVYGGDDNGDLWRFDMSSRTATKLAATGEPISTVPQLALVSNQRVVYFGTGRYVTLNDINDTSSRGLYGIKDDNSGTTITNPQTTLKRNTLVGTGSTRVVGTPPNNVNWATDRGWYIPLPDAGERVNIDPKLQLGVFTVVTNVPSASATDACVFGGYSWLNQIDIQTGQAVKNLATNPSNIASTKIGTSLAVGVTVIKLPNGKLAALVTTSDNQHPTLDANAAPASSAPKRVSWRDLNSQ